MSSGVFQNHSHWSAVKEVCDRLGKAGYQALLAGGCVRDLLMNREPNDFDIATDATPDQVEALFPQALTVGKQFGVTILPFPGGFNLEVATFREDLEYKDGRRPEGVKFSSPEKDAQRRDFTVNALFMEPGSQKVIDFVGGQADIQRKIIRTVGKPEQRFEEDKLRLLRAVRFTSQLGFTIASDTLSAIIMLAPEAAVVSRERIRDEIVKLLKPQGRVTALELLLSTGLFGALFPKLALLVFGEETEWLKRFEIASDGREVSSTLALAIFHFPAGQSLDRKTLRETHLKTLKLDNAAIDEISFALESVPTFLDPKSKRKGEIVTMLAHAGAKTALELCEIEEIRTKGKVTAERVAYLDELKAKLTSDGKKPPAHLSGTDGKAVGIAPGPRLGALLNEAYLLQLEGKLATRDDALDWLKKQTAN